MTESYKDRITAAMTMLGQHPKTCVIGYNTMHGKAGGTLAGFPEDRIFEMPLAENLMAGAAVGMSLEGWTPIIWFERADFTLCAMDALVNHLAKLNELSQGIHRPACIIRVAVGNSKIPLFTGATHCQDFSASFRMMRAFEVMSIKQKEDIMPCYETALEINKQGRSAMLTEYRDLYNI